MTEKPPKTAPPNTEHVVKHHTGPHSHFQILAPGAEASQENCAPNNGDAPFVSAGKKIHNEMTYRGIDFLLNSAIGVAFTYWASRTKSGEQVFTKPVTEFFKKILSPVLKSEAHLNEGAKWGSMFTSIIVGGTTIIPPMVIMENKKNKKAIVKALDEKIYGKDVVASDPKFQECYNCIDEEPKKNFSTGMVARLAVLAPMIAVTMIPEANKHMVKYLYNPIAKASKWMCEKIGIQPKALVEAGRMEIADGDVKQAPKFLSDWDFIHRTIGFDLGLTFIYSFAHEWTYKGLAAVGFKKNQEPDPVATAVEKIHAMEIGAIAPEQAATPRFTTAHAQRSFAEFAAKPEHGEVQASV